MVTMGVIRESPMPASASAPIAADPAVSIVVLNYNYGRFVAAAIESALAQTAPGCEVIVVDNGSTDDSAEVIARYADRVRVVRQPVNIGQGQGYNLGIAAARGEWIVWLDADDLLDPDAIATCLAAADAFRRRFFAGETGPDEFRTLADLPPIPPSFDTPASEQDAMPFEGDVP